LYSKPKPIPTKTVTETVTYTTTTTAVTTVTAPSCPEENLTADFEDLTFTEPEPNPPPKPYKGLIYENFYVNEYDGFIPPASGKNTLMSYDSNIPRVIKPAKGTFDLYTMAVGCSSGYPQAACEIIVEGKGVGGKNYRATYIYPALDNTIPFQMITMPFKQWYDLTEVRVVSARLTDRAPDDPYTPGFFIDDVRYNLKNHCDYCPANKF
jgi:hypothetical protein